MAAVAAVLALAACQDAVVSPASPETPTAQPEAAGFQRGYILRDGKPWEVVFEVRDGRAIFEGDIDLGPAAQIARTPDETYRRRTDGPDYGVITSNTALRWGSGYVPYVIESNVPDQWRITNAMAHIESRTGGVDFMPRTTHTSWIIFRRTTDPAICGSSPVGRQGGGQVVLINDTCAMGPIIHEIGHSLGFWHEQSRCDRDSYVQILWNNIVSGRSDQFDKYCSGVENYWVYDESSIMHYRSNAFGKPDGMGGELTTISSLRGRQAMMGQRDSLSTIDRYTINHMYRPYPPTGVAVSYPGNVPTVTWNAQPRVLYYKVDLLTQHEVYDTNAGYSMTESAYEVGYTYGGSSVQDPYNSYTGQTACDSYGSTWQAFDRHYYSVTAHYANGDTSWNGLIEAAVAVC
jgi:Astacin (Peptidase family M12A)